MIASDKQYEVAKQQFKRLNDSLLATARTDIPAIIQEAGKAQIQELMEEIKADIYEYRIKKGVLRDEG